MTHHQAMAYLYRAKGKTITIRGEVFTVKQTRMTYGAGLALTLDRPRTGKTSRIFTLSLGDECLSIDLARTITLHTEES